MKSEEEKEGYDGNDLQKRQVLSLEWKSEGWWNTNNNNEYDCSQHNDCIRFYS